MAYKQRREARYRELLVDHFTPREARELSRLAMATPALRRAREDRRARWARFERIAAAKIAKGAWTREQVRSKWVANLARLYHKKGWRVKRGASGRQEKMSVGSPNPWELYRDYERTAPPKRHVSPWEVRQVKKGKTLLDKGLIFIQRQVKTGGTVRGVPDAMVEAWIKEKDAAIAKARGQRRLELIAQRDRLRESLA